MSAWDTYLSRLSARGKDRRSTALQRERRFLTKRLSANLSYHHVIVDGIDQELAVINSDDFTQKVLCSLPGDCLPHGGLVEWMDSHWLITELDVGNEVYSKGIMRRCNYQLRWVANDGNIIERWCIVEDGTKYLTGEYGDNNYVLTRGDTRIAVTLPNDEYTIQLNRKNRFLIDHLNSPNILAYELTKPFKLGNSYGDDGVLCYVMQECNTEDGDNFELRIANYYDRFPTESGKDGQSENMQDTTSVGDVSHDSSGKRWF